jgi:hypothetical protein
LIYRLLARTTLTKLNALKLEIVDKKKELQNTSAQDQFSKWAKLRRHHDKLMNEYTELTNIYSSSQGIFSSFSSWGLYILVWLVQIITLFWLWRTPVFYLPEDWFGPLTSWMKFPFAPFGSVGVFYWWSAVHACLGRSGKVISLVLPGIAHKQKVQ